jgi:hypothetical protein
MRKARSATQQDSSIPRCGLCGSTENLTKTECCNEWICDDEDEYRLFSYAQNSCSRNHRRLTVCANHDLEGHEGKWQDCQTCRENWDTEMYVYYATNEFNFVKLENPPSFEPTLCYECKKPINLAQDGYSSSSKGYSCLSCANKRMRKILASENLPRTKRGRKPKQT